MSMPGHRISISWQCVCTTCKNKQAGDFLTKTWDEQLKTMPNVYEYYVCIINRPPTGPLVSFVKFFQGSLILRSWHYAHTYPACTYIEVCICTYMHMMWLGWLALLLEKVNKKPEKSLPHPKNKWDACRQRNYGQPTRWDATKESFLEEWRGGLFTPYKGDIHHWIWMMWNIIRHILS